MSQCSWAEFPMAKVLVTSAGGRRDVVTRVAALELTTQSDPSKARATPLPMCHQPGGDFISAMLKRRGASSVSKGPKMPPRAPVADVRTSVDGLQRPLH